ncbi:MAG: glycine cleavage system aminomethyltransferase GcvT [Thermoplasmatota archaeon]
MANRTALFDVHKELGGRIVEFAGYEMPVMYDSVIAEHEAVRKDCGIFDVSHMGNLWLEGPEAAATLAAAFVGDIRKIAELGSKYSCILNDDGTIIDDLYAFHLPGQRFHVIPNAGRSHDVAGRIRAFGKATVDNTTDTTAILAIQGPNAPRVVETLVGKSLADVKRFHVEPLPQWGPLAFASRTGYTGEDGFELVFPASRAVEIFRKAIALGAKPCGLGARDTLRLEKGYCLAGNEFAGGRTPLEAGLSWLIDWDHEFGGREALLAQKQAGLKRKLVAIRLIDRGIPRHGNEVRLGEQKVGEVTSGTMSPTLREGIALAYVDPPHGKIDTELAVMVRDKPLRAKVVKLPFV